MTDELERLAAAWQGQEPPAQDLVSALARGRNRLYRRRLLLSGALLFIWVALFALVLLGYEGRGALAYAFMIGLVVVLPGWFMPVLRRAWSRPHAADRGVLEAELDTQRALARTLAVPIPQVALGLYAALAVYIWMARGVFEIAAVPFVAAFVIFWLVLVSCTWLVTLRMLRNALDAIDVLVRGLGRAPEPRSRATVGLLVIAAASIALVIAAGVLPVTYIQPARDWEAHLHDMDRRHALVADRAAQRIVGLNTRMPPSPDLASRRDAAQRIRARLATRGDAYLQAIRFARRAAHGGPIEVVWDRAKWLLAAEGALEAERMGPAELTVLLRAGTADTPCLQRPPADRMPWLAEQEASPSDLDCLLATLEDPRPPTGWRPPAP